jgi:iron complex transport system substrate-binding protein
MEGSTMGGSSWNTRWRALLTAAMVCGAAGCDPSRPTPAEPDAGRAPRIVSLAPSLTDMLLALDAADTLAGRSSACRLPPALAETIPVAGDFGVPSIETLVRLRPDVIVTTDLADPALQTRLAHLGLRVEVLPAQRLDDIPAALRALGAWAGRTEQADVMAADWERALAGLRERADATTAVPVYLEIWGDPMITAGRESYLTEMIALAGGRNIFADTPGAYFQVSAEAVAAADPEVMLFLAPADDAAALRLAAGRPGWTRLRAPRAGRVRVVPEPDRLQQPGRHFLDAIATLRTTLARRDAEAP